MGIVYYCFESTIYDACTEIYFLSSSAVTNFFQSFCEWQECVATGAYYVIANVVVETGLFSDSSR